MNRVKGFTLIELIIVVAIIGILAAVAIPSYSSYVLKAHRAGAVNAVLDLAGKQARYYRINNTYTTSMTALGYASDPMPIESAQSHHFDLSVLSADTANFTVQAVPYGKQTSDVCGTFTYNDLGKRDLTGGTGSVKECWKQ